MFAPPPADERAGQPSSARPTSVTVMDHLLGKPERSVALYHAFVGLIAACGDYTVSPSKTTITFKGTRRGFAGAAGQSGSGWLPGSSARGRRPADQVRVAVHQEVVRAPLPDQGPGRAG